MDRCIGGWKGQMDGKDRLIERQKGWKERNDRWIQSIYIYGRDRWIDGQKGLNDRWIQRTYIYGRDRWIDGQKVQMDRMDI